jgi:DNA-binding MurR/RpiR family transcriptional regulator
MSPVAGHASLTLPLRIEAPSSWDSNIVPLFVAEALIAAVANADWPRTQSRLRGLERLGAGNAKRR